jgi:hypothetical protein
MRHGEDATDTSRVHYEEEDAPATRQQSSLAMAGGDGPLETQNVSAREDTAEEEATPDGALAKMPTLPPTIRYQLAAIAFLFTLYTVWSRSGDVSFIYIGALVGFGVALVLSTTWSLVEWSLLHATMTIVFPFLRVALNRQFTTADELIRVVLVGPLLFNTVLSVYTTPSSLEFGPCRRSCSTWQ